MIVGPNPPDLRRLAAIAYYNEKLFVIGGEDRKSNANTNLIDVINLFIMLINFRIRFVKKANGIESLTIQFQ